jgi:hypothetical protein
LDGPVLTVTTTQSEQKLTLTDQTRINKTVPGATTDLTAGATVLVAGRPAEDGSLAATSVTIQPAAGGAGR